LKTRDFITLLLFIPLVSCTSSKNTSGTRWYHSFNTRYNVYFNGNEAYNEAYRAMMDGYQENYSEMLLFHPVSALPKDKAASGGSFDKAIEKSVKAIKTHSIQTKPDRKDGKQNDPKYKEFMSRKEYNPFLHNAWMMMARSQFFNGDFLEAASSFSYISRLYESQPEISVPALIWKARSYSEMEWYYDAEDILKKIDKSHLENKDINNLYSTVYADLLFKQKEYSQAVPYMQIAIKAEKNGLQRNREKYILGQMLAETGNKDEAYRIFRQVSGSSAPYPLTLNAKIRETEVFPGGDVKKMTKNLTKMTKSSKNEEYLDLIYYALGNVYMSVPDTAKAVESYELGVEKSTKNGIEKALNEIRLGDIYFTTREYLKAQPNYADALSQLKKEHEAYPRVAKRSEVLDQLVVHFEAVELQDSLLRLSKMTKEEQLVIVNKIIEDLIKKEKEDAEKAAREEYEAQRDEQLAQSRPNMPQQMAPTAPATGADAFYFYNSQAVALGKTTFQQKWGRRKLEDDWRRRNKANPLSDQFEEQIATEENTNQLSLDSLSTDSVPQLAENEKEMVSDPKDPEYYLQQIPVTEEDIAAANAIIEDGLYNMAVIYKDLLEDSSLALETFDRMNTRYPDSENRLASYNHIYMIYLRLNDMEMANLYKQKILEEFPESDLAIAMADPDYEYNLKMMNFAPDSLYRQTYSDYLENRPEEVRTIYGEVSKKFTQSKLMPKFMFLNALTFVQTNEPDTFKVLLKQLIDKFPEADVSLLAGDIMKGFQRGLQLSASGENMLARGSIFNMRFGGAVADSLALDSTVVFTAAKDEAHELLLLYPKDAINGNLLLYTVASYNFGNFLVNDFDLERQEIGDFGMLHIKGFKNYNEVMQYISMINTDSGYVKDMGLNVLLVPISLNNFGILMKGRSLDEYFTFFEENFAENNEKLIARWKLQKEEEEAAHLSEEAAKAEQEVKEEEKTEDTDDFEDFEYPETINIATDTVAEYPPEEDGIEAINDIYSGASDKIETATSKWNEFASDPIRGFLNLFKRDKKNNYIDEYAKQQEKEEKARLAALKKAQDERNKFVRDSIAKVEKELAIALKQKEKEEKARKEAVEKEEKRLKKEKEDAKKAAAKQREEEKKAKEKLRKETLKQKEKERKEKEKLRREEQKKREQARKDLQKQREAEQKAKKKK
jgi:tetratricopeptide (TPR) repeat protein